jgi:hypothetical protein
MRLTRHKAIPAFLVPLSLALLLPAAPAGSAELRPSTYSNLFSRAKVVAYGKVTSVSTGFLSDGRQAGIEVEGLHKGRAPGKGIKVSWNDVEHKETCYEDGARVIVFLIMRKDSTFAQVAPGVSCWSVEKVAFGSGRPVSAVSYEFPLDLVSGIPKGATRETEVVEKSLNFQVPKRKKWILVDALLPPMKAWKPPKTPRKPKVKPRKSPVGG